MKHFRLRILALAAAGSFFVGTAYSQIAELAGRYEGVATVTFFGGPADILFYRTTYDQLVIRLNRTGRVRGEAVATRRGIGVNDEIVTESAPKQVRVRGRVRNPKTSDSLVSASGFISVGEDAVPGRVVRRVGSDRAVIRIAPGRSGAEGVAAGRLVRK